jgi:hypothetical protein
MCVRVWLGRRQKVGWDGRFVREKERVGRDGGERRETGGKGLRATISIIGKQTSVCERKGTRSKESDDICIVSEGQRVKHLLCESKDYIGLLEIDLR